MAVVDLGDDVGGGPDGRLAPLLGIERAGGGRVGGERFVVRRDLRQDRGLRECCRHPCRTRVDAGRFTVCVEVYAFSGVSRDIRLRVPAHRPVPVPAPPCPLRPRSSSDGQRSSEPRCLRQRSASRPVSREIGASAPGVVGRAPSARRGPHPELPSDRRVSGLEQARRGRENRVRGGAAPDSRRGLGVDHGVHGLTHRARAASAQRRPTVRAT